MARRRTLNYRELRSYDEDESKREDEEEGGDESEEEDDEEEAEEGAEASEEEGDEEEEEPVVKKPKKKAPAKEAKPKRTRAAKVVRMRIVWGVFNNSNQPVARFDYSKRTDAEEHAAKLQADKKQTYFVQPIREPMDD